MKFTLNTLISSIIVLWKKQLKPPVVKKAFTRPNCLLLIIRTSQARLNHGHQNRQIWVFNSLTRQKEPLSFDSPVITWYSCGPTVYDEVHIGHASCYIRQDAIRRVLSRFQSKPVIYALGVTDVDDKIIARARNLGEHESVISRAYEKQFFDAMRLLNIS